MDRVGVKINISLGDTRRGWGDKTYGEGGYGHIELLHRDRTLVELTSLIYRILVSLVHRIQEENLEVTGLLTIPSDRRKE